MVQLVVVACTRDDPGKGQIKGKKWCLESENKMYSEIVMQK